MEADPLDLAEAAARGDGSALGRLLEHYLPELRAFVRLRAGPLVRARESNSDLVQSVCREILQHGESFRFASEDAFRRWLFTTTLRKLVDRRDHWLAAKRDAMREVSFGGESDAGAEERLAIAYRSLSSPSRHAMARETIERLEAAFDDLPEDYREVVTLAKVAGLSRAEIAAQMGRSEGSVRMLLVRALAELAARLEPG
jgi:RNA polymerase sigma-70 factor (ECF subfamily)